MLYLQTKNLMPFGCIKLVKLTENNDYEYNKILTKVKGYFGKNEHCWPV